MPGYDAPVARKQDSSSHATKNQETHEDMIQSTETADQKASAVKTTAGPALPDSDDVASTLAGSTCDGYAASEKPLLPGNNRRGSSSRPKKTAGRKTYEGVCGAVNVLVPIDVDHDKTSMDASSLARLVTGMKGGRSTAGRGQK